MTHLSLDPLTLTHVAISLIAIAAGLAVFGLMLRNADRAGLTAVFLAASVLTSVTGFFFHPANGPTPAQFVGAAASVILLPTLFGLYVARLRGAWRPIYAVGALVSLYLNVFVLVIQAFQKIPSLFQPTDGAPPGGPVFGGVQAVVLILFVIFGWRAVKRFRPSKG